MIEVFKAMVSARSTLAAVDDILLLGCAVAGAWAAVVGVNTWRHQLVGTAKYETSVTLLRSAYSLRDAVQSVRWPSISAWEFPSEGTDDSEREASPSKQMAEQYVYSNRWERVDEATRQLDEATVEAEILFGSEARKACKSLRLRRATLLVNIRHHLRMLGDYKYQLKLGPDKVNSVDDIVYDCSEENAPDDFTQKLQAAVKDIEGFVRPHIRP